MIPSIIDIINVPRTLLPNSRSPNLHAILPFTILFDITAIKIEVVATNGIIIPSCALVAIS